MDSAKRLKWDIRPAINRGTQTIHFTPSGTPRSLINVTWDTTPVAEDGAPLPKHAHTGYSLSGSEDLPSLVRKLESVDGPEAPWVPWVPWVLMSMLSADRPRGEDTVRFVIITVEGKVFVICAVATAGEEDEEHMHEGIRVFSSMSEAMEACEDWHPAVDGAKCDCTPKDVNTTP